MWVCVFKLSIFHAALGTYTCTHTSMHTPASRCHTDGFLFESMDAGPSTRRRQHLGTWRPNPVVQRSIRSPPRKRTVCMSTSDFIRPKMYTDSCVEDIKTCKFVTFSHIICVNVLSPYDLEVPVYEVVCMHTCVSVRTRCRGIVHLCVFDVKLCVG